MPVKKIQRAEVDEENEVVKANLHLELGGPEDVKSKIIFPEFDTIRFSNEINIRGSKDDLCLDFLEMPGVVRDGKVVIRAVRIYVSHKNAKRLCEGIESLLTGISKSETNDDE